MPRYFFRLTDGNEVLSPAQGLELLGNAAARDEVMRLAREIKRGNLLPGRQWDGWFVAVVDEQGAEVESVPIDAVPAGPEIPVP